MVSERPAHLVVATSRGTVEIPWVVHDMLLARLCEFPEAVGIVEKLEAADSTGLVTPTSDEEALLHEVAAHWIHEAGADMVPASVVELRDALRDFFLSTSRGEIEIEWDSHNLLLERLEELPAATDVVTAFKTAGASHLHLTDEQMAVLRDVVSRWLAEVGPTQLPPGILELNASLEELDDDVRVGRD